MPAPAAGWAEQNIEVVPGGPVCRCSCCTAIGSTSPLAVTLSRSGGLFALIDRALVRVEVGDDGTQHYRVSYRLARLSGRSLDFELPAPAPTIRLQVGLDGRRIAYEVRRHGRRRDMKAASVRLRLSPDLLPPAKPGQAGSPAMLEIAYRLDPDRMRGSALTTPLVAPRLLGERRRSRRAGASARPSSWVVLGPEAGPATPRVVGAAWLAAGTARRGHARRAGTLADRRRAAGRRVGRPGALAGAVARRALAGPADRTCRSRCGC